MPPKSQCRIWAMDRIRPNNKKKIRGKLLQPSVGPQKYVSPPHPSTPLPWPCGLAPVRRSDIFGHVRWKPLEPVCLCAGSRAHSQVRTTSGFFLLPPALFINLQIQTCRLNVSIKNYSTWEGMSLFPAHSGRPRIGSCLFYHVFFSAFSIARFSFLVLPPDAECK